MELISVVIPVFNAEKYLGPAIESVLAQNWPAMEVLVVDNCSTDNSMAVAHSFDAPVRCLYSEPPGQPPTHNAGVREAQGNWLAFIDADDIWTMNKLHRQFNEFKTHPELDVVFGHAMNFEGTVPNADTSSELKMPAPLVGTMLIRRAAYHKVGNFDEKYSIGSMMDWYLRAQEADLHMRMLPDVFLYRRVHGENLSLRQKDKQIDFVRILRAAQVRRRKKSRIAGDLKIKDPDG